MYILINMSSLKLLRSEIACVDESVKERDNEFGKGLDKRTYIQLLHFSLHPSERGVRSQSRGVCGIYFAGPPPQ